MATATRNAKDGRRSAPVLLVSAGTLLLLSRRRLRQGVHGLEELRAPDCLSDSGAACDELLASPCGEDLPVGRAARGLPLQPARPLRTGVERVLPAVVVDMH
eukprot:7145284-Alexandrium_andersonii.AAC.2